MDKLISIITPTRNRHNVWPWYEMLVTRAIKKLPKSQQDNVEIILVDDSDSLVEMRLPWVRQIRRQPSEDSSLASFLKNLTEAAGLCRGDYIFIWEDDDWHSEDYLVHYLKTIENGMAAVGQDRAKYYHLPTQSYYEFPSNYRASLCQTAFHKDLVYLFLDCLEQSRKEGDCGVDIRFWWNVRARGYASVLDYQSTKAVGIKGFVDHPLASGHDAQSPYYSNKDVDYSILRQWIGDEDADELIKIARG